MDPAAGRPLGHLLKALARVLDSLGLTPNGLTVVGFLGSTAGALILAAGHPLPGAAVFLLASALDMMDGTLARLQGTTTRFGALLDSTLDRYSEVAILTGLVYYKLSRSELEPMLLILILSTLAGSLMVSYVRARAESLGLSGKTGIFQRPERVLALSIAIVLPSMTVPILATLALGTHITVVQRLIHCWRQTRDRPHD